MIATLRAEPGPGGVWVMDGPYGLRPPDESVDAIQAGDALAVESAGILG